MRVCLLCMGCVCEGWEGVALTARGLGNRAYAFGTEESKSDYLDHDTRNGNTQTMGRTRRKMVPYDPPRCRETRRKTGHLRIQGHKPLRKLLREHRAGMTADKLAERIAELKAPGFLSRFIEERVKADERF